MSKRKELECDGCGTRVEQPVGAYPSDWRRLHITAGVRPRQWVLDVCSPFCASKAVDSTYAEEDRRDAALHLVRQSSP